MWTPTQSTPRLPESSFHFLMRPDVQCVVCKKTPERKPRQKTVTAPSCCTHTNTPSCCTNANLSVYTVHDPHRSAEKTRNFSEKRGPKTLLRRTRALSALQAEFAAEEGTEHANNLMRVSEAEHSSGERDDFWSRDYEHAEVVQNSSKGAQDRRKNLYSLSSNELR